MRKRAKRYLNRKKNPLVDISISQFFNIESPENFRIPYITKSDYLELGVNLGFVKGLVYYKGEEQAESDIKYFYDQQRKKFSGLVNMTSQEAFEYGVISGLYRAITLKYTGDVDKLIVMETKRKIDSILHQYGINLTFKSAKGPVTFY